MPIKQKGGIHNYISNTEYINLNKASDIDLINALTNKSLNKFRPTLRETSVKEVERLIREAEGYELDPISNVHNKNANREAIESYLTEDDKELVIYPGSRRI